MELGMIGLGRMGAAMVRRIMRHGHQCVVYDVNAKSVAGLTQDGAQGAASLAEFVKKLAKPRAIWLMLPAALVDTTLGSLLEFLEPGDIVIDGGNSYYHDDIRRSAQLKQNGIIYVDVGTSGGVWGLDRGFCLMIGGEPAAAKHLEPIFVALAPGVGSAARTAGRENQPISQAEQGYLYCGPSGAGHFVKMVHNGIEYGIMAAYAEGLNVLQHSNAGKHENQIDAETTPLRDPHFYQFEMNLAEIAEVWRRGSVIGGWLMDLTASALVKSPKLEDFSGHVSDSGEGRWTVAAAIDEGVPVPVLSAALYSRFSSRGAQNFADRLLSALRFEFGGHKEKRPDEQQPKKG